MSDSVRMKKECGVSSSQSTYYVDWQLDAHSKCKKI